MLVWSNVPEVGVPSTPVIPVIVQIGLPLRVAEMPEMFQPIAGDAVIPVPVMVIVTPGKFVGSVKVA